MRVATRTTIAPAVVAATIALAAPAGAVNYVYGAFLQDTANAYTGFENIGAHGKGAPLFYGPYQEDGLVVEHIGGGGVATTFQHEGNYSFYGGPDVPGYTDVKLADGNAMNAIQFDASSEMLSDEIDWPFQYELLYKGNVVDTGTVWKLCSSYSPCFRTFGFDNGLFDELRIQGSILIDGFDPQGFGTDTVVLDNIYAREVPEPAMWMLMIAGFAIVGSTLRRRKGMTMAVSFA